MQTQFNAMTVVSPASMTGEEKNQDRAGWHGPTATACVCDGVSSSPHAEQAAEAGVQFSPVLFLGDPSNREDVFHRLLALCDLLLAKRMARWQEVIARRQQDAEPMQRMLQQVAEQKLTQSFQTTLAAVHLLLHDTTILGTVVTCGDASFAAFESDGVPLNSSQDGPSMGGPSKSISGILRGQAFYFGPGATLLVKVRGHVGSDPALQRAERIRPSSAQQWLVTEPLDQCLPAICNDDLTQDVQFLIAPNDRLLIPTFLIGHRAGPNSDSYLKVPYSRNIRVVRSKKPETQPAPERTNVTCVLPDHRGEKFWTYFQETFPADAHFVVASDGFTNCFSSSREAWLWLKQNELALQSPEKRPSVLQDLHAHLQNARGDDDISFVWIRPEP